MRYYIILILQSFLVISTAYGQVSTGRNYVHQSDITKPGVTTQAQVDALTAASDRTQQVSYFDGLGRPIQSVVIKGSNGSRDIIQPVEYDAYGREVKKFLPYTDLTGTVYGSFRDGAYADQRTFYDPSTVSNSVAKDPYPFSQTLFELSPVSRPREGGAPGQTWQPGAHTIKTLFLLNTPVDDVKKWKVEEVAGDWGTYTMEGTYNANELYKTITVDEHSKQVIEFKDKEGKVLLKKVQLTATADNGNGSDYTGWLCTYYIYDDQNNLRCVIQPKGVEALLPGWDLSGNTDLLDEQCFRYRYDERVRMTAKKVPGAGEVYMIYDKRDRLVFTQDAKLRLSNQWLTTLYDALNRPVVTGILVYTGTPDALQASVDISTATPSPGGPGLPVDLVLSTNNASGIESALRSITLDNGFETLSGGDFTAEIVSGAGGEDGETSVMDGIAFNKDPLPDGADFIALTRTHYDDYEWTTTSYTTAWNSYLDATTAEYPVALPSLANTEVKGMVTGMEVRTLNNPANLSEGIWLRTTNFYDEKRRPIQVHSDNHKGGVDIVTNLYDFSGKLLVSYQVLQVQGQASLPVKTRMKYDANGKLVEVWKTLNNDDAHPTLIVKQEYDELGQLKTKELGRKKDALGNYTETPLETLDHAYNIRGWLKGINKSYANGITTDRWFGMELFYESGFDNAYNQYNGNIGAMRWLSSGAGDIKRNYAFGYDAANRLMKADFTQDNNTTDPVNFSMVMGDGSDPALAYDANGNILKMKQWGLKLSGSVEIDELKYTYQKNGLSNKLKNVIDLKNDENTILGDFRTAAGHPQIANKNTYVSTGVGDLQTIIDYTYDVNGNLTEDRNKNIADITYNHLNLPWEIQVNDDAGQSKGKIVYLYDASGNKLQKKTIEYGPDHVSVARTITTDYVSGRVYETKAIVAEPSGNYTDKLQFLPQEEGRIRAIYGNAAEPSQRTGFEYDYMVKDHLGNVRLVLTEERKMDVYPAATLEGDIHTAGSPNAVNVEQDFYTIDAAKIKDQPSSLTTSYTNENAAFANPNPSSNPTASSQKMYELKASSTAAAIGLGITLKVMAGDRIDITGRSYWNTSTSGAGPDVAPAVLDLLSSLLGSPTGAVTGAHANASNLNGVSSVHDPLDAFIAKATRSNASYSTRPRAFINYVFVDEQFRYVEGNFSAVSNGAGLKTDAEHLSELQDLVAKKNGYVYIYCSNESQVSVFFDNLQVAHTRGPVLEETHYYPFGLTMAGISSKALAFGEPENRKKFNGGTELNKDLGLNWYETSWRGYDPQIGAFRQIDMMADKNADYSPYSFVQNNPILFLDPLGLDTVKVNGEGSHKINVRQGDVLAWTIGKSTSYYTYDPNSPDAVQGFVGGGIDGGTMEGVTVSAQAKTKQSADYSTLSSWQLAGGFTALGVDAISNLGKGAYNYRNSVGVVQSVFDTKYGQGRSASNLGNISRYSQRAQGAIRTTKFLKAASNTLLVAGLAMDWGQVAYAIATDDPNKNIFIMKSSANTAVAAYGLLVPGVGWVISGAYFLGDSLIPGGWPAALDNMGEIQRKTSEVLGTYWNPYNGRN